MRYILDIKGEIEGDYEIIGKYEERPKGKWITKHHVYGVTYCSECDFELKIDDTNFCPYCGADMRVDEEEML